MSDKLPGISGMTEAQLREQYAKELGREVPEDLTTTDKLRAAIKAHRDAAPKEEPTKTEAPKAKTDEVVATKGGETRTFPKRTWDLLGSDKAGWEMKAPKPADLK